MMATKLRKSIFDIREQQQNRQQQQAGNYDTIIDDDDDDNWLDVNMYRSNCSW